MCLVPPAIQGPAFRTLEAVVNQTVKVYCTVEGMPPPNITWSFNGQQIENSGDYDISRNDTLHIKSIQAHHDGSYNCLAVNKYGRAEAETYVKVVEPPSILQRGADEEKQVVEGGGLELECFVRGSPTPKVEWRKNGEPIEANHPGRQFSSGQSHYIRWMKINIDDAGKYTCVAINQAGEARRNIQVVVLGELWQLSVSFQNRNFSSSNTGRLNQDFPRHRGRQTSLNLYSQGASTTQTPMV